MLSVNEMQVSGIRCYEIVPTDEAPKADILLYHGWGSHATKQCFRGKLLAGFGYRVLVPEIKGHGYRGLCDYESPKSALTFMRVLYQSIREAEGLIRQGLSDERSRFVIGHSLGGMIALGSACENAAMIHGFVAMNSTADWSNYTKLMKGIFSDFSEAALQTEEFQEIAEKLAPFAPMHWSKNGMNRPILLTNGALDHTLPAVNNEYFCMQFPSLHVQHLIFPEAGHVVTDGMLAEVIQFIERHRVSH